MIFTREQWQEVYQRYRAGRGSKEILRPPEPILAILELDAIEHGLHPDWVRWWVDDTHDKWANALYVMLNYRPGQGPSVWWTGRRP